MKRLILLLTVLFPLLLLPHRSHAQAEELEQLALDIEKLAQMKNILQEMYKGYKILTDGFNTIKSLAEGNFNIHSAYLTGLLQVSPAVKQYVRVADIISAQASIVTEYKSALKTFRDAHTFSASELTYLSQVYTNLFDRSLDNLDELAMVLTDNRIRASDAERLSAIDHIYNDMADKLAFLRSFNSKSAILASQRQRELQQNLLLQRLIGQ